MRASGKKGEMEVEFIFAFREHPFVVLGFVSRHSGNESGVALTIDMDIENRYLKHNISVY